MGYDWFDICAMHAIRRFGITGIVTPCNGAAIKHCHFEGEVISRLLNFEISTSQKSGDERNHLGNTFIKFTIG